MSETGKFITLVLPNGERLRLSTDGEKLWVRGINYVFIEGAVLKDEIDESIVGLIPDECYLTVPKYRELEDWWRRPFPCKLGSFKKPYNEEREEEE